MGNDHVSAAGVRNGYVTSGAERLKMGSRMFLMARQMMLASFPPGLPELEIKRRLCERLYGDEVDIAGFIANLQAKEER